MANPRDVAARKQIYLERYKAHLKRKYRKEVTPKLAALMKKELDGLNATAWSDLSKQDFDAFTGKMSVRLAYVFDGWNDALEKELSDLADYERDEAIKTIENAVDKKKLSAAGVALKAATLAVVWNAIKSRPVTNDGKNLLEFITTGKANNISSVIGALRNGFYSGLAIAETKSQLIGTKSKNYRDGWLDKNAKSFDTQTNTVAQHVAQTAEAEIFKANSDVVKGYRWVSVLDERTSDICAELDGQVFQHGQGPLPPMHNNCRSDIEPDILPQFASDDYGGNTEKKGYYYWLKEQPKSTQENALGKTRAKLFREGGLKPSEFARFQVNKNYEPLTLAEMKEKRPDVFEKAGLGDYEPRKRVA